MILLLNISQLVLGLAIVLVTVDVYLLFNLVKEELKSLHWLKFLSSQTFRLQLLPSSAKIKNANV